MPFMWQRFCNRVYKTYVKLGNSREKECKQWTVIYLFLVYFLKKHWFGREVTNEIFYEDELMEGLEKLSN